MKRQIIKIDEKKCNGCGNCIPNCPEGAIQIIDGKARVVNDSLCDGLGACIGHCPEGAISFTEKDTSAYNEIEVLKNIIIQGENVLKAHIQHLKSHNQTEFLEQALKYLKDNKINIDFSLAKPIPCGCPSMQMSSKNALNQWPIQLALLNPFAPFFENTDLLISADCVAHTFANFHNRFLKDKTLIIFCPKLDINLDVYIQKLTEIFKNNTIKSITILRMEVPCCGGVLRITEEALKQSGKNILIKEYTISLQGEIT